MVERADALPEGFELDRYRIKQTLGEGGFSITYLASHAHTGKIVVIKEYMPSEFALRNGLGKVSPRGTNAESAYRLGLSQFIEEARTLEAFVEHPNIVSVRDFFEANDTAYMIMQYEEGVTLAHWLRHNPHPTEQQLLDIFIPILDGLREIHSRNFLHRDIKPENIYIRNDGRPLLIDFGASRLVLGQHSHNLTSIFTPGFAPKEQYSSRGNQGAWTDVYSTAATMWQAVTRKEPETALDRGDAIYSGQKDPLLPARDIARGLYSDSFLGIIDWALAFEPKNRPQTVHEWQVALLNNVEPQSKLGKHQQVKSKKGIWLSISIVGILVSGGIFFVLGEKDFLPPSIEKSLNGEEKQESALEEQTQPQIAKPQIVIERAATPEVPPIFFNRTETPEAQVTIIKPKLFLQTVGVQDFLKKADDLKGRSFKTDPAFPKYCKIYGLIAVKQAQRRIDESCSRLINLFENDEASQWSLSSFPQEKWCLTVSSYATEKETLYRENKLKECVAQPR